MAETEKSLQIYQFHVLLRSINPPIWRRILMHSESNIADFHYTIQIAFHWSDFHLHRFLIRGQEYGLSRAGCAGFSTDPTQVSLVDFKFRNSERFLYEYDFSDLWQHQVRFEKTLPMVAKKIYPVCVGGARAAPPEDCGGPQAYMELLDHHQWNWPREEVLLIADTLSRLLDAKEEETIRACIENMDELQEAVTRLKAYYRFEPHHFDRRAVNQRLKQYAEGNQEWMWK